MSTKYVSNVWNNIIIFFAMGHENIWHNKLRHVNIESLSKFVQLNYLSKLNFDNNNNKCQICVEAKLSIFFIIYKGQ